jgi:hypothetical protein
MFTPLSKMSATLQAHLRYPEDIFSIQSAIYGRYHLTSPRSSIRPATRGSSPRPRARAAVAGAAGATRQLPGSADLDQPGPHGAALPGVGAAGFVHPGLHRHRRLRAGVAVELLGLEQPEPERVHGGHPGSGRLRRADRLRDAAGHPGPGQRDSSNSGQSHGVVGHHALRPARARRCCSATRSWCRSGSRSSTCDRSTWPRPPTRSRS